MDIFEVYDEAAGGTLVSRTETESPSPDAQTVIAALAGMTEEQKASLREALGL